MSGRRYFLQSCIDKQNLTGIEVDVLCRRPDSCEYIVKALLICDYFSGCITGAASTDVTQVDSSCR